MAGRLFPRFALYGDSSSSTVDFIHIERLRDRSEIFDWSIDAHTHAGLDQVVLLLSGHVRAALDADSHDLGAPAVIAIPAGVVHAFEFEPNSSGFILAVPDGQLEGSPIEAWLRSRLFAGAVTLSLRGGRRSGRSTRVVGDRDPARTGNGRHRQGGNHRMAHPDLAGSARARVGSIP